MGLTQYQLGDLTDVSQALISKIERGHIREISTEALRRVGAFLGVPVKIARPERKAGK